MERTKISGLKEKIGREVLVKAWLHEVRDQSKIKFVLLRDNSGIVQTVITPDNKEVFEKITKLPKESVISLKGIVKEEKQAPTGLEISVKNFEVLSESEPTLPVQVVEKGEPADLSKRLDYRWIDLRKPKNLLIFKIWTASEIAMREFWENNDFIQVYSPKVMGAPSESGAELFSIKYFGREAYLAQSPQFYKQMAMAAGFEKFFEIGPVFRAEPSHTSRHNTEFTMIDMEISFIDSHEDVMKLEEEWLAHVLKRLKQRHGGGIKKTFGVDIAVPKLPFPRMTFAEAKELLKQAGHELEKPDDLDSEGERLLGEIVKKKYGHEFVFVTEYPWSVRPFYHMRKESDKNLTKSYDLLYKGLEITTGAQREHRHNILKEQAVEKKLSLNLIEDYLNFFKYGCPPHGGFGVGFARLVARILGINNIREITYLPRDTQRIKP